MVPYEISNGEIREALLTLDRAMTTQVNRDIGPSVNTMESTMTSRLRDFLRMNHRCPTPIHLPRKTRKTIKKYYSKTFTLWHNIRVERRKLYFPIASRP